MSNVGKWDDWYKDLTDNPGAFRYSDTETYRLGALFLEDCNTVEDWGTGAGGFKRYCERAIGVDGSNTPHAEKKYIDLTDYVSECEGIFMRHVLEHNYDWGKILNNLLASFTKKACIVMFIPFSKTVKDKELAHNLQHGVDVPDLAISKKTFESIVDIYGLASIKYEELNSISAYGKEIIIYLER